MKEGGGEFTHFKGRKKQPSSCVFVHVATIPKKKFVEEERKREKGGELTCVINLWCPREVLELEEET